MENKNYNTLCLIKKQNEQIKNLKKVILDLYSIIKIANEEDNLRLLNITYGVVTLLVKETLNLNY